MKQKKIDTEVFVHFFFQSVSLSFGVFHPYTVWYLYLLIPIDSFCWADQINVTRPLYLPHLLKACLFVCSTVATVISFLTVCGGNAWWEG